MEFKIMEITKGIIEAYIVSNMGLKEYCRSRGLEYSKVANYVHNTIKVKDKDLYMRYKVAVTSYGKTRKCDSNVYNKIINEYIEKDTTLKEVLKGYGISMSQLMNYISNILYRVDKDLYARYKLKVNSNKIRKYDRVDLHSYYDKVIEEYLVGGVTMRSVCSRHNINEQSIYNYIHNYLSWKEDNDLYRRYIDRKQKK